MFLPRRLNRDFIGLPSFLCGTIGHRPLCATARKEEEEDLGENSRSNKGHGPW